MIIIIPENAGGEPSTRDFNDSQDSPSSKKRKISGIDINLENAPTDEVHPIMQNKSNKEKQSQNNKKTAGRPRK